MENKIESVKINQFGHEVGCLKLQAIVVKTALHPSCESKAHLLQVGVASLAKLYPTFKKNPSGYLWLPAILFPTFD